MLFPEAQRKLAQFLAPLGLDEFLDQTLVGGFRRIARDSRAARLDLLGADPEGLLAGAVHLAPKLTFHSANPGGPPPSLAGVEDAADFRRRIAAFHDRKYSVRLPDLRPLSPALDGLARALEIVLSRPVTASAFWSRGGMRAPVHYDDHDLLVVQLQGAKRWYVSTAPSQLFNPWKDVSGNPPELGPHEVVDLTPGDVLYLPRGTFHTVDSDQPSVHVALGFTPLTLREAVIAALDHLSDLDRPLRATVGGRLAFPDPGGQRLVPAVADATQRLLAATRTPGFLAAALQRRASRTVGDLEPLRPPVAAPPLGLDTVLRRAATACSYLTANDQTLDFAYPGGHLYIHRGAQDAVVYIAKTPSFRVRDIAGPIGDDVRLALAEQFLQVGFLEMASVPAMAIAG